MGKCSFCSLRLSHKKKVNSPTNDKVGEDDERRKSTDNLGDVPERPLRRGYMPCGACRFETNADPWLAPIITEPQKRAEA